MNTKFITNKDGQTLYERFNILIKNTKYFDVLVGYFYLSGFYKLESALENTDKIRILVGLEIDSKIIKLNNNAQQELDLLSSKQAISLVRNRIKDDLDNSEDNTQTYNATQQFIRWIQSGKIEIRLYKKQKIHSKIYIMSFRDNGVDHGRVITGSSNFTQLGLDGNIEYNVELRDDADYYFAKDEFEKLWLDGFSLESEFIETINTETWISESITPYQLYLKFLYEHFKDDLETSNLRTGIFKPDWHKDLEYQKQAVISAKKLLNSYGGVFIADVVGLGKTIMGALLLQEYPQDNSLIIAPPHLLGNWETVNVDYKLGARVISVGKLEQISKIVNLDEYSNIIIDEAHRFRNEATDSYVKLAEICRGKRIILLSATPYNNNPKDLLALVKLFQSGRDSNIPNLRNVEAFLSKCDLEIRELRKDLDNKLITESNYFSKLKFIAIGIREKLLRYVMIRRTRDEIIKYFSKDLTGASFPILNKPIGLFYQLNSIEADVFSATLNAIKNLTYAPLQNYYLFEK